MPFTPFHLGPGFLVGGLFHKRLNLVSILLASVLVDLRVTFCFFFGCLGRFHGPLHTFVGATIVALLIVLCVFYFRNSFKRVTDFFRVKTDYSFSSIFLGSFVGAWMHIVLDAFMHSDMIPFWPLRSNFLLGMINSWSIVVICIISFFIGLGIYLYNVSS